VQLYFIEEKENTNVHQEILDECLPDIRRLMKGELIFLQDNAPLHSVLERRGYFTGKPFETLQWPPERPELNPIENI
jgi:hypothetical protein